MSKSKDVGGRPIQKADFEQGPVAADKFLETMRQIVATPKKEVQGRKQGK